MDYDKAKTNFTFTALMHNTSPEYSPSHVTMDVDNAQDLTVDYLLDHFSRFLVACGFAQYTFEIVHGD